MSDSNAYPGGGDKQRSTWRIGLFECFSATDSGFACCCAYWCCAPCTWSIAMRAAGIEGSEVVFAAHVLQNALPKTEYPSSSNTASSIANVARVWQAVKVRRNLYRKLYGTNFPESDLDGYCYHCFCPVCAYIQEVDAVMAYYAENKKKRLVYGSFPRCAQLYFADTGHVVSADSITFAEEASGTNAPLIIARM